MLQLYNLVAIPASAPWQAPETCRASRRPRKKPSIVEGDSSLNRRQSWFLTTRAASRSSPLRLWKLECVSECLPSCIGLLLVCLPVLLVAVAGTFVTGVGRSSMSRARPSILEQTGPMRLWSSCNKQLGVVSFLHYPEQSERFM